MESQIIIGLIVCGFLIAYAAAEWCLEYVFARKDRKPYFNFVFVMASALGSISVLLLSWSEFLTAALVIAIIGVVVIYALRIFRKRLSIYDN